MNSNELFDLDAFMKRYKNLIVTSLFGMCGYRLGTLVLFSVLNLR